MTDFDSIAAGLRAEIEERGRRALSDRDKEAIEQARQRAAGAALLHSAVAPILADVAHALTRHGFACEVVEIGSVRQVGENLATIALRPVGDDPVASGRTPRRAAVLVSSDGDRIEIGMGVERHDAEDGKPAWSRPAHPFATPSPLEIEACMPHAMERVVKAWAGIPL